MSRLATADRSHLLVMGLSAAALDQCSRIGKDSGFGVKPVGNVNELDAAFQELRHCLGIAAGAELPPAVIDQTKDFASRNFVNFQTIRTSSAEADLQLLLRSIFHPKLRELCLLAAQRIFDALAPQLQAEWKEIDDGGKIQKADFIASCDCLAPNFSGSVSIRSSFEAMRKRIPGLANESNDSVLNYAAEIGNETMGIITRNLHQLHVSAEIGLPTLVLEGEASSLPLQGGFFLPRHSLRDQHSEIELRFQFLVPFLKELKADRSWNLNLASDTATDEIEMF